MGTSKKILTMMKSCEWACERAKILCENAKTFDDLGNAVVDAHAISMEFDEWLKLFLLQPS